MSTSPVPAKRLWHADLAAPLRGHQPSREQSHSYLPCQNAGAGRPFYWVMLLLLRCFAGHLIGIPRK
jgi:hypothetical protein